MIDYEKIGLKIKENRKRLKLTQKSLGEKIGKTESSIQKYEKGLTQIPNDVLEKLADVFQIPIFELIFVIPQIEEDLSNNYIQPSLSLKLYENIKASQVAFDEEKLNKIIEKQLISKELSNSLTQYFKAQNKDYNDEEIRDLIEQTFIFLEVLTSKKSK
ncbi:helix-turn-helix domain-containing protein [Fusobacterium mortiferum]|uniref:helix-turn-helix domain-containing protein n=1 Tax=Fusobacterium mortiferum TaxID=850 RepID=UPI001958B328|nr:helix-turn-helix transcriptional regulator [Fusobacterium mortiferum]